MHPLYQKAASLTEVVIDAACEVQSRVGIGVLESIYQKCLCRELTLRGHTVEMEVPASINYKGYVFDEQLRLDLLVDDCLIIECKALDPDKVNMPRHKMQLLSYMRILDKPLGLVINFCEERLGRRGIGRVILKGADSEEPDSLPF